MKYAAQGIKITPLTFLLKAVVEALQQFPDFNASLDAGGEKLILRKYFHIGVAVDIAVKMSENGKNAEIETWLVNLPKRVRKQLISSTSIANHKSRNIVLNLPASS